MLLVSFVAGLFITSYVNPLELLIICIVLALLCRACFKALRSRLTVTGYKNESWKQRHSDQNCIETLAVRTSLKRPGIPWNLFCEAWEGIQKRYATVLRLRLPGLDSPERDALGHSQLLVSGNESMDEDHESGLETPSRKITIIKAGEEEEKGKGQADRPRPVEYIEKEELSGDQGYEAKAELNPVRLLAIFPHLGDPYSSVQGNLVELSMRAEHYRFTAIRNARGNLNLMSNNIC
jgi:hypothetical protein